MSAYIRLLRHNPDFARLWLAQVISMLGDWFNVIALSALVSRYSAGSGLAVSGLLLARFLPPVLVSPFAGVLIDRFNRKHLLIISDVARMILMFLLLFATGPDTLWLIYGLTVLQFCFSSLFEPGRSAIMPSLVQGPDLLVANTLGNVTWSVMLAVGAMIGGVVAAAFGAAAALVIDALSFGLSAWFISQIKTPQARSLAHHEARRGTFREGVRYLTHNPSTAALLLVKIGQCVGNVDTLLIAYGTVLFVVGENGTGSLGILYSAFGLGSILGPLLLNRFSDGSIHTMRRLAIVGFVLMVIGWLLFGLAAGLLIAAFGMAIRAMGGSVTWTYSSTMIQMSVPDEMLGRVFSFDMIGFSLTTTASTLITGWAVEVLGSRNAPTIALATGLVSLVPLVGWIAVVYWLEQAKPKVVPGGAES
ncbi:MAG TPA: MFS transporter [Phototrophicaceae bacterium]|nr:MFS transporter [Phototrophicaceae bacterium]